MKKLIRRVFSLICALCLLLSGWEGGLFSAAGGRSLAAPPAPGAPLYAPEGSRNTPPSAVVRTLARREASWAYWEVRVNPDKETLNGGSPLVLSDTFDTGDQDHLNQSIDYASVAVSAETAEGQPAEVSYDYSGQTGTFTLPDAAAVTITYRTRIKAQPGEVVYLRGGASLRTKTGGEELAAVTTEEGPFTIYPSASDVASTGARYMLKLFVYPEGRMQAGVPGVTFILLDDNQRPMEYRSGPRAGQPVTFTTGSDGYADIAISGEEGAAIEKNTAYYLEMMQAVEADGQIYQKDNQLYSFMITDDPGYNSGGVYTYYNGDTMKVRLYPAGAGLTVSLRFTGNYALREDQRNAVAAVLQQRSGENWTELERHDYSESRWGAISFTTALDPEAVYRVVEENEIPWDLPDTIRLTASHYCMVGTGSSEPYREPQDFYVASAGDSVNVVIDNRYEEPQLTVTKMDKNTGAALPGAEFGVYRIQGGAPVGSPVTTLTTDGDGMLLIAGGETYESEILYGIRETAAPQGYLLPQQEEWHYFYFCNDDYLIPTILADLPQGAAAFNLSETYDNVTVDNRPSAVTIPVMKIWQGNVWPADIARVVVGLYRSVDGGEPEPVLQDGVPRTVSLSAQAPYSNVAFANLPARDGGRDITYSVREEHVYDTSDNDLLAQYVVEYGVSDAGVYVVRNKPAASLTVRKQWYDRLGALLAGEDLAAQPSVTFDVYRTTATVSDEVRAGGITDDEMTAFLEQYGEKVREGVRFGSADGWTADVRDLDLRNDQGARYHYYVLETVPSFGDEVYEASEEETAAGGSVTIRNEIAPETALLTVTKAPLADDPRPEAVDNEFTFTLKLQKGVHPIRSYTVYDDGQGTELTTDWNGEVSFTLLPEYADPALGPRAASSITLSLPVGVTASVTETENPQYTVQSSSSAAGTAGDGGRSFSYEVESSGSPVLLTFTNTLRVVCMVVTDTGDEKPFESLKSALTYLRGHPAEFTAPWTVYMLEDYRMPAADVLTVAADEELLLTTAMTEAEDSGSVHRFHFHTDRTDDADTAVITRFGEGGSLLKNEGRLTLEKVCLDGAKDSHTSTENGGLVYSTGTLELKNGAALRNSASPQGGAVFASGAVTIGEGASVTGCSAPSGSAIYLAGGTLTMTGGTISGNSGASDGAVATANVPGIRVYLSGSPVIFGNTGSLSTAAANLSIGADSDQILNVVDPGLGASARIGVSAMAGHMEIGEQFATTEYGFYENLQGFINDRDGYRGKLKDGTSINVVWEGLKLTVEKTVAPTGADPDDRFTIILSSPDIKKSSYIINGTLDYAVTAAREGRPGRIVLSNVKDGDSISISPLPVGDYTIAESSSNYAPVYTLRESGSAGTTAAEGGHFRASDDCTVTVTNTRRLADVKLTKSLQDNLVGDAPVDFSFVLKLTEADASPVSGFQLAAGVVTDGNGEASVTLSPTIAADAVLELTAPVGAAMTVTETADPDYMIVTSARTLPDEGEAADVPDLDPLGNVFAFAVTDDGADLRFSNVRNMAGIELKKVLEGKVSETESFTFDLTLWKAEGGAPASGYTVYEDAAHPENSVTTDDNGKASVTFVFGPDAPAARSLLLSIPEGAKLVVEETDVNGHPERYDTTIANDAGAAVSGRTATVSSVSGQGSLVYTNTRKTRTITVTNTVNGYSGNVVPFTYSAVLTQDGEASVYGGGGFSGGAMSFELVSGQVKTLTVPYDATLTVTEGFIVGYETTVKRGSAAAVTALSDSFTVGSDLTLAFANAQLIGLRLVNETSSALENVTVTVGKNKIYRVNADQTGQELIGSNRTATLSVAAGKTAILEIQHDTDPKAEQAYTVSGTTPAEGYYYTIQNEPSFHEFADPAFLRVYDRGSFSVGGKLRYSVADSTVTFTEQPLVSFDAGGGVWTTEMEDYHDRDGDRQVYQKAVDSGGTVSRPTPDPIYPTAEGIAFLGWTADAAFAAASHTAGEDVSAGAYDFDAAVTGPVTLYAVWAKPARDWRVVTVRNGRGDDLTLTAALQQNGAPVADHALTDSLSTDASGEAVFTVPAGGSVDLAVPDGAQLTLSLTGASLAAASALGLSASTDHTVFTVSSVGRDGTVTFLAGVCKITDGSGNVLYDNTGKPAVYETLKAAFTAYDGTLYSDGAQSAAVTPAAVKLLVDEYALTEKHTFPNRAVILTTAGKNDADFPYEGVRDRSVLRRASAGAGANCFTLSGGNITLTEIVLDGGSEDGVRIADTLNGGLISMSGGILNVTAGTTIRNCEFTAYNNATYSRGGAIHMSGGTLNVDAGRFSNLHARRGGAINAESGAVLNITGVSGGTRFEDCGTNANNENNNGGDGGAICCTSTALHTLNGGTDSGYAVDAAGNKTPLHDPGIVFVRCVAGSAYGDGGAIYANTNKNNPVSVSGCEFVECSCRLDDKSKNDTGFGGGAICAKTVKSLSVSFCRFRDCDSIVSGGAVMGDVNASEAGVSIANCAFENCKCKAQGGGVAVYQDDRGATSSATRLSITNSTFSSCSSGTSNGSGGAVQCYLPCMTFTDSEFSDCWAGKEGGAVNNYFGSGYTAMWANASLTVDNCRFVRCRAEDRYDPTAAQHYGGAINTKVKAATVTDSYFEDCVSTLKEGGALHLGGQGVGSTATVTGSTFKNCTAKNGGGAVLASAETLTIENSFFYGCSSSASSGGAVYHYKNSRGDSTQKVTTITGCTFSADPNEPGSGACGAANNGGAVWTRAATVTISGCTLTGSTAGGKGGAVYLSGASTSRTISGTTITGCTAPNGSAVYQESKCTYSGVTVTGNAATDANGGALAAGSGGTMYFEGNTLVRENTYSGDGTAHNVVLHANNASTIFTTDAGLGATAEIGVYAITGNVFNNRGKEGQAFGTFGGSAYLDGFVNDRQEGLYGFQSITDGSDKNIYWGTFLCKITDAEGNTLLRPNGRDAVYPRLDLAFVDFTAVGTANPGTPPAYIKMLVEEYNVHQAEPISSFPTADVTLTTATKDEPDGKHPYRGSDGTVCTISRSNSTNPLFRLENSGTTFRLADITLDGRKNKTAAKGDFRILEATRGKVVVNGGTTFQYGYHDSQGGAISIGSAALGLELHSTDGKDILFDHCTQKTANAGGGGAIWAENSLTVTAEGSGRTRFLSCSARHGGAVMVTGDSASVEIDGAEFLDCEGAYGGGAIYHDSGSAAAYTTVRNSSFDNCFAVTNEQYSSGGALYTAAPMLTVGNCSFTGCRAKTDGGAIYHAAANADQGKTAVTDSAFSGCSTTSTKKQYGYGGSIFTQAGTVELTGGSVSDSTAFNHGGALYCQNNSAGSSLTVSGTAFERCIVTRNDGRGGAICARSKAITLEGSTSIHACAAGTTGTAASFSGAVHPETDLDNTNTGLTLNIRDTVVISGCYANKGGAIYLKKTVTMNLSGSPEFTQNGYRTAQGTTSEAAAGACIYLDEGSLLNLSGSPKFSRNILPNRARITNGSILDNVRQDVYLAGYDGKSAASIHVTGELTGDTIWIWPEKAPHRLPGNQFATTEPSVSAASLNHFRNALSDGETGCSYGEYLSGVRVGADTGNVYWDKMYVVSFKKIDNKAVAVPGAGFTLYEDASCTRPFGAGAVSADGETDTDAWGNLMERGRVEFASIPIGAYYMKETQVPGSFRDNSTTYLVLVGSPFLDNTAISRALWEGDGPLNVPNAQTLVARHTTDAGKYYGVFPLDGSGKAVLTANIAANNVGLVNIRSDYQVRFMKVDGAGAALPGAAFTIYTQIAGQTFSDGFPKLELWSRDGETYPAPVRSADGSDSFKDVDNQRLPEGMVYFRELPLGTYYLLETAYPERNGNNRRTYYIESDRVFRLKVELEDENDPASAVRVTMWEWHPTTDGTEDYRPLDMAGGYYVVSNSEAVCKLTDGSDNLLYTEGHEIWEKRSSEPARRLFPAIYPTLEEGFAAAQTETLVNKDWQTVADGTRHPALKLQALKDLTLSAPVAYSSPRALTLTTAKRSATPADRYVFSTSRTRDTSRAEIRRGWDEASHSSAQGLVTVSDGAGLTLQNINLIGQKARFSGRAVDVQGAGSSLTVGAGAMLQDFRAAAGNGGAVRVGDAARLTINGGYSKTAQFSKNEAGNGGAIDLGQGCTVSLSNAQFTSNTATDGGGAIRMGDSEVTVQGAVFSKNSSNAGGAVFTEPGGRLTLTDTTLQDNSAASGGAVCLADTLAAPAPASLRIVSGSITGNKASADGGAVCGGAGSSVTVSGGTLNGNQAASGGAVCGGAGASVTISGGVLTGNRAALGSAVYGADGAGIDVTGGAVTGNKASDANGGAINVGGENARIRFGGAPTVFDNLSTNSGDAQQRNVVLSTDTNQVIRTMPGGLAGGALIGVYVTDALLEAHGLYGMPFGTFDDADPDRLNPEAFRNDRFLVLCGTRKGTDDRTIYWNEVICKLTTDGGALLYQDVGITVRGTAKTYKAPAVYPAVQSGFNAAQGTLYTKEGNTYRAFAGTSEKLKLLRDVELTSGIDYSGSRSVEFTTAETTARPGDSFVFRTERADAQGRALVTRGFDGASLISAHGAALGLADITLDGAKGSHTASADGGLVNVASGSLTVAAGAVLRDSAADGKGGAVYVASGAAMGMNAGVINGNTAAVAGAGVCLAQGGRLELSGAPDFGGTGLEGGELVTAYSGGAPAGNFVPQSAFTSATLNGGKAYPQAYGGYTARQDVFIEGYEGAAGDTGAVSLAIVGEIGSGEGTIWVWAEKAPHYQKEEQFATRAAGVSDDCLAAFRNARDDASTGNDSSEHLFGSAGEKALCVYWGGGSIPITFRKLDGFGEGLGGAGFTLYKAYADVGDDAKKFQTSVSATAAAAAGDATLQIGDVRFAVSKGVTYYLQETTNPDSTKYEDNATVYQLAVGDGDFTLRAYDGTAASGPDLAGTGILNVSLASRRVILRKSDDAHHPLRGAQFHVYRANLTEVGTGYSSLSSGVWFTDALPYGLYYLHETGYPAGVQPNPLDEAGDVKGWWFTLRVDGSGVSCSAPSGTRPAP